MRVPAALLLVASLLQGGDGAGGEDAPDEAPTREIAFRDAVELGLLYNLGLKTARVDALVARLEVDVQEARWDPALDSTVGGGETVIPSRSQLAGASVVDTDAFNATLGLTKPLRLGPTLGLVWRTDRTFTNSSFSTINPAYDTALELNLTVPLLRGRGRTVQEADLRASEAGAAGARYALVDRAAELILQVAEAYWTLYYLQDRVAVLEKSLAVAREIEEAERRKLRPEIGRSTPLDVTQAQAETFMRASDVIEGRFDAANAADELRRLILPFTGTEADDVVLRAVSRPEDAPAVADLTTLVETALARRADLRRTDTEIQRSREEVVKAEDALAFQLDLGANVTWRGVDAGFSDSAATTLRGDFPSASASLHFIWPFGRRAARAALRQAELGLERAELGRRDQVNTIIVEVRQAHRGVYTALEAIRALEREVTAADASLEGERLRLQRGSSTVIDVARLERNLTESRLRLLDTRTKLEQARLRVARVTGTLLDDLRLELGPDYEVRPRAD